MLIQRLSVLIGLIIFSLQIKSQNVQFGNVSPKDFDVSKLNADTSKGAVIISDAGVSTFEGNNKSWFTLIFKRKCRILITNKNGLDLANVKIPLYISGNKDQDEERIEKLKGSTYNLVDGKVIETKLNSDAIFKEKYDKNHIIKKFTLPAVKEGSIIEYSYTINSDFLFNLQPWEFQSSYPTVWSEYEVDIPEFFEYVVLMHGHVLFDVNDHPLHASVFNVRIRQAGTEVNDRDAYASLEANVTDHHWAMKNVPALIEEKYTTSINNHIAKLEFQLSGFRFRDRPYQNYMGDWNTAGEKLLKSEDFGADLKKNNNWLDDDMKIITAGAATPLEKAGKIYYYIRSNIKCNDDFGMWLSQPIKDVFKNKRGSIADVNLLLTAMLIHENLLADPVILSTRKNGITQEDYPLLSKFNYVISKVTISNIDYYLDVSQSYNGFGHLPAYCYNGHARIITATPSAVYFYPDGLQETNVTNVMLYNDDKIPGKWEGSFQSSPGYFTSSDIRELIHEKGKTEYEKYLKKADYDVSDITFDDLDDYEKPVHVNYTIKIGEGKSDIIYFTPMIKEGYSENPFKSAERKYPVEMPYKINETYSFYMDIPEGYTVDELPASTKVMLNENDGYFEYIISKSDAGINMRSKIKLEKATFSSEDYETLRNFFSLIVKKQSEQIVFKKKK